jgi:hypothetical protein
VPDNTPPQGPTPCFTVSRVTPSGCAAGLPEAFWTGAAAPPPGGGLLAAPAPPGLPGGDAAAGGAGVGSVGAGAGVEVPGGSILLMLFLYSAGASDRSMDRPLLPSVAAGLGRI